MKKIVSINVIALVCTSCVLASGYRIPEQSFAATAKSAANIASTNGADASYYNPANMPFLENKSHLEFSLIYINLPSIKYTDAQNPALNSRSKVENFLLPSFHYVSPEVTKNLRFGLSFTAPGGLSKRWDDFYAKSTAQKFSLKILELNPTVAYKLHETFSLAFGPRMTYIDGQVKSEATRIVNGNSLRIARDLKGDSFDFGYNVALTYKPIKPLTFAATYRSNIDLSIKGDATLVGGPANYSGGASINIPLPAVLDFAISYDFGKTIIEAVYERTYWSKYKNLDFNYERDLTKTPLAGFDLPLYKGWKDVNAYRIGVTHKATDKLTLYGGFAYDKSPANKKYFGFELPDSDARLYSVGLSYDIAKNMTIGVSYLYDSKKKASVNNRTAQNPTAINGTFKNGSAHLLNTTFLYKF